jgi:hypothetical protein
VEHQSKWFAKHYSLSDQAHHSMTDSYDGAAFVDTDECTIYLPTTVDFSTKFAGIDFERIFSITLDVRRGSSLPNPDLFNWKVCLPQLRELVMTKALCAVDRNGRRGLQVEDFVTRLSLPEAPLLRFLRMDKNALSSLPQAVCAITSLVVPHLGGNQLRELPAGIGALVSLQHLDLNHNHFRELPETIGNLKELQTLRAFGNSRLERLPETIASCGRLSRLLLGQCSLFELPGGMAELTELSELQLEGNPLRVPKELISRLIKARSLARSASWKGEPPLEGLRPLAHVSVGLLLSIHKEQLAVPPSPPGRTEQLSDWTGIEDVMQCEPTLSESPEISVQSEGVEFVVKVTPVWRCLECDKYNLKLWHRGLDTYSTKCNYCRYDTAARGHYCPGNMMQYEKCPNCEYMPNSDPKYRQRKPRELWAFCCNACSDSGGSTHGVMCQRALSGSRGGNGSDRSDRSNRSNRSNGSWRTPRSSEGSYCGSGGRWHRQHERGTKGCIGSNAGYNQRGRCGNGSEKQGYSMKEAKGSHIERGSGRSGSHGTGSQSWGKGMDGRSRRRNPQ